MRRACIAGGSKPITGDRSDMSDLADRAPNIEDPDGFYAELLQLHEGLEREASEALNARLVLILANQIGDRTLLRQAFAAARAPVGSPASGSGGS